MKPTLAYEASLNRRSHENYDPTFAFLKIDN